MYVDRTIVIETKGGSAISVKATKGEGNPEDRCGGTPAPLRDVRGP